MDGLAHHLWTSLRPVVVLELWKSTHRWTSLSLYRHLPVRFLVVFVLPVFLQTSIFCYQNPPSSSSLRSRPLPERDPHRDPPPSPPTLPLLPLLERSPRNRRSSSWIETLEPSRPPTRLSSMEAHRSTSLLPTGRVRHSIPGHAETFYRRYRHGPLPSHQEVSARRLDRHRWAWSQRRRGRCDPQDQCRGPSCCSCRPPFFHLVRRNDIFRGSFGVVEVHSKGGRRGVLLSLPLFRPGGRLVRSSQPPPHPSSSSPRPLLSPLLDLQQPQL
ncbi:hypothetical protein BDY24DRAFT_393188, partial [Mrakia frigida]|uniref:uncharacterized protein n=1 Tax=Mrakia frigida TaxID=29902 RepID=UPI003FCBF93B